MATAGMPAYRERKEENDAKIRALVQEADATYPVYSMFPGSRVGACGHSRFDLLTSPYSSPHRLHRPPTICYSTQACLAVLLGATIQNPHSPCLGGQQDVCLLRRRARTDRNARPTRDGSTPSP